MSTRRARLAWGLVLCLCLMLVSAAASGQSSNKCTVTANGQTTQVRSDGSYLIQNIPVGNGLIRVEASCVRDGVTLYGASIFKGLSNGQTIEYGPVPLSPEPIPTVVTIRASSPGTLPDIGETGQISVQALLSDATTFDVTLREQGSAYASSNPSIVSVGPDGLVTAVDRGKASITVTNQGATSTVRVAVAPPGDPLTTVEGFVLDPDGNPVTGALVEDLDHGDSALTDSQGFFCLGCPDGGPPALDGDLRLQITGNVDNVPLGAVARVTPVPGRASDAGVITLRREFALRFDGVDDLVTFGLVQKVGNHTIEAWLFLEKEENESAYIVGHVNGDNAGVCGRGMWLHGSNGHLAYFVDPPSCGGGPSASDPDKNVGVWVHAAGTWDGSTARLYVNGEFIDDAHPKSFGASDWMTAGATFHNGTYSRFFTGIVDEIRVWNKVRTPGEIQSTMFTPLTGIEPGLVGYWPLNEGTGQQVFDLTSSDVTGDLGTDTNPESRDPVWVPSGAPVAPRD